MHLAIGLGILSGGPFGGSLTLAEEWVGVPISYALAEEWTPAAAYLLAEEWS
jgi:hypothetical protein